MAKLTLNTIGSRYGSIDALNDNSDLIETAFENTLSRDGTGPNNMESDLDMDSNDIINVANLSVASLRVNGQPVSPGSINYTGQVKETQTATSGQTVFNLSTVSYAPLTNNLSVYVDGVYQNPTTYTENNSTRITFDAGVHIGAVVDFVVLSLTDLPGTIDASNVIYTPGGSGAATTTVETKLRETVSVKDFGAVGDGVTDDRAAVQAAFNSGSKSVLFPEGTYWFGQYATSDAIIDLTGLGTDISIKTNGTVEFVCETTASGVVPRFFVLNGNSHFYCDPIRFRDLGYVVGSPLRGAIAFLLEGENWGNVTFTSVYGKDMLALILSSGAPSGGRIRGINIGNLFGDNCLYVINCQNQGDGINIDNLVSFDCIRPYFVYGVTDHNVKIFNRKNKNTSGAINISRNPGGLNTSGINITYVSKDNDLDITHVLINQIDLLGGVIENIRINVDIESSVAYDPVRFVNYTGSGGSETTAPSLNTVRDIHLTGSCDSNARAVTCPASYAAKHLMQFFPGNGFNFDTTILNKFYLNRLSRSGDPVWGASGTAPNIGNGVDSAFFDIVDGVCTYSVIITMGSTTTYGTGGWEFTLPFTPTTFAVGSAYAFDSGTAYYVGAVRVQAGSNIAQLFSNGAVAAFGATNPFTWATGDVLQFTITFSIS
jgi:hypothetical protein